MSQEFSNLNGYAVKDATARQQIDALNTTVAENSLGVSSLTTQVNNHTTDIEGLQNSQNETNAALSGIGNRVSALESVEPSYVYDGSTSTVNDYTIALTAFENNGTPIIFDDGEKCAYLGQTDDTAANIVVSFFKASTNQIVRCTLEDGVTVEYVDIDASITTYYDEKTETLTIGE